MTELIAVFLSVALFKFARSEDFLFLQYPDKQTEHVLLLCEGAKQNH